MIPEELLSQLQRLSRADKLEVMQILVNELALEEARLMPGKRKSQRRFAYPSR